MVSGKGVYSSNTRERSSMSDTIPKLTIEGFKSIRELKDFELRQLNILL